MRTFDGLFDFAFTWAATYILRNMSTDAFDSFCDGLALLDAL